MIGSALYVYLRKYGDLGEANYVRRCTTVSTVHDWEKTLRRYDGFLAS